MPDVSGLDLLKQLRVMEAGSGQRTPVVILSADVTPDAIRNCERAGARAFLAKPVVATRLLDTLAELKEYSTGITIVEAKTTRATRRALTEKLTAKVGQ